MSFSAVCFSLVRQNKTNMRPCLTKDVFKCVMCIALSPTQIPLSDIQLEEKQSYIAPCPIISVAGFSSLSQFSSDRRASLYPYYMVIGYFIFQGISCLSEHCWQDR